MGGGGQPGHGPTQSRGRGTIMSFAPPPKLPKSFYFVLFLFFESEFGSIPKNSGLNPWSIEFWRYPRLEPAPSCPPLKPAAGSASDDTFHIISLIKETSSAIIDLAIFFGELSRQLTRQLGTFSVGNFFRRALTKLKVILRNPPLVVGTKNIRNRLFVFLLNWPRVGKKGDSHRECSDAN